MPASRLVVSVEQADQCGISASAGGRWTLGLVARQTRLVIGGCTCPLGDEEEAMSTAEPLGEDRPYEAVRQAGTGSASRRSDWPAG
jgi:hypothetical protein